MSITRDQVSAIAELARLQLDDAQLADYEKNLGRILDLADQLSAADTANIAPLAHPLEATQRLRADVVTEEDRHNTFQQCAPLVENDHYIVPKVVE